jgi:hypothetical protein
MSGVEIFFVSMAICALALLLFTVVKYISHTKAMRRAYGKSHKLPWKGITIQSLEDYGFKVNRSKSSDHAIHPSGIYLTRKKGEEHWTFDSPGSPPSQIRLMKDLIWASMTVDKPIEPKEAQDGR